MSDQENPLEPFKRATVATMRALAGDDELDVSFGQGPPTARGNRIRVPLPTVGSSEGEVNAVRGIGDEFALKLRYHDDSVHHRNAPAGGPAQEMFQWIEDARIAVNGVAPFPVRLDAVERMVRGNAASEELANEAGEAAIDGARALGHNDYKIPLMRNLVRRAVRSVA